MADNHELTVLLLHILLRQIELAVKGRLLLSRAMWYNVHNVENVAEF